MADRPLELHPERTPVGARPGLFCRFILKCRGGGTTDYQHPDIYLVRAPQTGLGAGD
ncbi:MAG: hypothetical protein RMN51_10430 [Verrucomicrobiota bacterium]|nr:hypothetical protein [Limisphaera sp.]MDW8382502.1 hypothetical protein [Verrucomicrobiota bacterium]